jgi:hypothetical protein
VRFITKYTANSRLTTSRFMVMALKELPVLLLTNTGSATVRQLTGLPTSSRLVMQIIIDSERFSRLLSQIVLSNSKSPS